ncbi:hypothetical protein B4U79_18403 [Dinothrombium tinctorium]|uniref:F-box domain-containing protein n=1 Tax=Dinothrombium tinctorium TaxID=1965070 RepID=A0A443QL70_9ACAR|nr:hypothetical protein B4U79_18403 [Dinothrombium tinctorium]
MLNNLPVECLSIILSFLSIREKLKLRSTCKLWNEIVIYLNKRQKRLTLWTPFDQDSYVYFDYEQTVKLEVVKICYLDSAISQTLAKIFPFIQTLCIDNLKTDEKAINVLTKAFSNLKNIHLINLRNLNINRVLFKLAEDCDIRRLEIRIYDYVNGVEEQTMNFVAIKCPKIEKLSLFSATRTNIIKGSFLLAMKHLKSLHLRGCINISSEHYNVLIQESGSNLTSIEIDITSRFSSSVIPLIANNSFSFKRSIAIDMQA